jgi:hypothetical protein
MAESKNASFALLGIVVMLIAFFVGASISGVPMTWLLHVVQPLSTVQNQLTVFVSPEIPTVVGQQVTVTVQDSHTGQPIEAATVSVSLNGNHLVDLPTSNSGQVSFEYPGEATIIVISASTYTSVMVVIPKVPVAWISDTTTSLIVAIVSGVIAAAISKHYLD